MQFSLPLQEENNHKNLTRNREKIETEETILKLSMRNIVGGEKDKSPFPSRLKNAFITASVSHIRFWLKETQSTNKSSIPLIGRHDRKLNIGRANPKAMFSFRRMIGGIEEVHHTYPSISLPVSLLSSCTPRHFSWQEDASFMLISFRLARCFTVSFSILV